MRQPTIYGTSVQDYKPGDFVITTVNVPDRLDQREAHYRAEEEYKRPGLFSFDRYWLGLWFRRIVLFTLIGFLGFWGYKFWLPIKDNLSAVRISERLSAQSGFAVSVTDTEYRLTPKPGFVLLGVQVGTDLVFDEIAIQFNWEDTWTALLGGSWSWGEALVSPVRLNEVQAWSALKRVGSLSQTLPQALSVLRFKSITLQEDQLLEGPYTLTLRRGVEGRFRSILVEQAGESVATPSPYRLLLTPPTQNAEDPNRFGFQFDAVDWALPFGPDLKWVESAASGHVSPNLVEIESFSLSSGFGVLQGMVYAAKDLYWVATGSGKATGFEIEQLVGSVSQGMALPPGVRREQVLIPFTGTANLNLAFVGRGDALRPMAENSVAAGSVQVRRASIRGVNLGYAATHGGRGRGLSGGLTRFTDFDALFVGSREGVSIQSIKASAGAMSATGHVRITPEYNLDGSLRIDLGATRVQAPTTLTVAGTLIEPSFGR